MKQPLNAEPKTLNAEELGNGEASYFGASASATITACCVTPFRVLVAIKQKTAFVLPGQPDAGNWQPVFPPRSGAGPEPCTLPPVTDI